MSANPSTVLAKPRVYKREWMPLCVWSSSHARSCEDSQMPHMALLMTLCVWDTHYPPDFARLVLLLQDSTLCFFSLKVISLPLSPLFHHKPGSDVPPLTPSASIFSSHVPPWLPRDSWGWRCLYCNGDQFLVIKKCVWNLGNHKQIHI